MRRQGCCPGACDIVAGASFSSEPCMQVCENTLVGNDWFRGVSGGQRKRVTAGDSN